MRESLKPTPLEDAPGEKLFITARIEAVRDPDDSNLLTGRRSHRNRVFVLRTSVIAFVAISSVSASVSGIGDDAIDLIERRDPFLEQT